MDQLRVFFNKEDIEVPKEVMDKMNRRQAKLILGAWNRFKIHQICPYIKQWKTSELWVWSNDRNIFKEIAHITFNNLQVINACSNNIQSLQGLNKIHLPLLRALSIENNNITNFRQLRKCCFISLKEFQFCENKVHNEQQMTNFTFPQVNWIKIQESVHNVQFNSLTWIFKQQTKKFNYLWISGEQRITQPRIINKVKNKYKNFLVYARS